MSAKKPVVNTSQTGNRPARYTDHKGKVSFAANWDCRTGPDKYYMYDGRIVKKRLMFDEEAEAFERDRTSAHAIRELIKGIMMEYPALYGAPAERWTLEIAYQIAPASIKRTMEDNTFTLEELAPYLLYGKVATALASIRNNDGDIEAAFGSEWADWGTVRDRSNINRNFAITRRAAANVLRRIRSAQFNLQAANEIRAAHPDVAKIIPETVVSVVDTGLPITDKQISFAERYFNPGTDTTDEDDDA